MKRHGNLYPEIIKFENLFLATKKAQIGKRFKNSVLEFNQNLESELFKLQEELFKKTYQPGKYKTFYVEDAKRRLISAAPYRDRIVHHSLCNIICPLFERTFISDSYANRIGFGTHKALNQFVKFARSSEYVLQCDIKKYFPSIDHQILKNLINSKLKCQDTLWLINLIIDNSNDQQSPLDYFADDDLLTPIERRKGIPIGNLSSQFFANIYLNGLDHFIKEKLKIKKYVRYVDDFALFGDNHDFLTNARIEIEKYLVNLRLKIHPIKSQLFLTQHGANFLGFRIFPDKIRVRSNNLTRARKRIKRLQENYAQGKIELEQVNESIQSWIAHLNYADTWQLQQKIFSNLEFTRN